MTFTPGSDEGRTDTYEAQIKLQEDDQTAEEQFDEAQQGLRDANTAFQRFLGIIGALQQNTTGIVSTIANSIGKDNSIVTPEQPIIEDVPQYPVVLQRILKVKKDNPEVFSGIVGSIGKDNTEEEEDEPLDVEAELKRYYEQQDLQLKRDKPQDIVISGAKVRTRRIMDRDLSDLLLKYPNIDPDRAKRYVDLNARGIVDIKKTIEYLNDVSLKNTPNPDDLEDVAAEFSVIFGVDAQVEDLQKIIEERGDIMFKTQSMDQPFVIRNLSDLKAAYFQRLNVLKKANVFDEGHVFAVNSLLRDKNVKDIATYKANIEPEIARSIQQLIDKQTLEELIAPGQGPAYLEKVVLGNRSRKDENDPDKAVARVFGGAYGVEEDFLNFMFPEKTVAERVPPELKDTFVDLYNKELTAMLQNFPKSKPGEGGLQIGSYTLERLKEQIQNLVADEMNLATGLNTALNETEYQRIKRENPEILLYLDERFGGKEEYVIPDKKARRIRRKAIDTRGLDEFRVGSSWDIGE